VNKFTIYLNASHLIFAEFKGKWSFIIGFLTTNDPPEIVFGRSPSWRGHSIDFDADDNLTDSPIYAAISIIGIHPVHSIGPMDNNCPAEAGFD
jgi:hypothetical protein